MPIDVRSLYPADAIEARWPASSGASPASTTLASTLAARVGQACEQLGVVSPAVRQAATVAVVRMAHRHGAASDAPLAYHNEAHLLDLMEDELPALLASTPLPIEDREALVLFCACHDLRQSETRNHPQPQVGANEAASLAETERLLDGLDLHAPALRQALRFAILGSTFAAGVGSTGTQGGAFAHHLAGWLETETPGWRDDPVARHAEHLARIAADLDTSNVAAPYPVFAETAVALAIELQDRARRPLDSPEAGAACLDFLSTGQERYVFELQRFASAEGHATFGARREANALRVRATSAALRGRFPVGSTPDAHAVIAAFRALAATP